MCSSDLPYTRQPVDRVISFGVRAWDGLLTVGRGQRVGLFAGSGVGKSTLMGQIARQTSAEVVVVSGGVSVGAHDEVKAAFETVGTIDLWRIAIQPGKPLAFGHAIAPDGRRVLLFGLPGNPVSSFVTFEVFVRPVIRRLAGRTEIGRAHV